MGTINSSPFICRGGHHKQQSFIYRGGHYKQQSVNALTRLRPTVPSKALLYSMLICSFVFETNIDIFLDTFTSHRVHCDQINKNMTILVVKVTLTLIRLLIPKKSFCLYHHFKMFLALLSIAAYFALKGNDAHLTKCVQQEVMNK